MRRAGRGITSLEILLTIALFGVALGTVSITLSTFRSRNALKDGTAAVIGALRRAETQALSGHFGDRWGVHFSDGEGCALPATKIHVFRGQGFVSATDTTESIDLPAGVQLTGVAVGGGCDVKFSRFHGAATSTGAITLTNLNGATSTVAINAYGRVVEE
ncbi:MAG TPA: hypothetical protein VJ694_02465 [Patescibacteria group bacterium]|nr:hypothetical protein [Patescibacteria group bacterium]